MATALEIVRGISQVLANSYDGALDENGDPIQGKVDTLLYNYGQCFTGSFASYPLFMLDFTIDDSLYGSGG